MRNKAEGLERMRNFIAATVYYIISIILFPSRFSAT
jgi:hypothetical protein